MSNKKSEILGMPHGTASNLLKGKIMFDLVCRLNLNTCYKCNKEIESVSEFSIEHKIPWESSRNADLFWDLENIAFSHRKCNRPHLRHGGVHQRKVGPEGTSWCRICKEFLDESEFSKDASRWNGIRNQCKKHIRRVV